MLEDATNEKLQTNKYKCLFDIGFVANAILFFKFKPT